MRKMRSQLKRKHRTLKENADKKTYLKMHKLEEDKEALGKKYGEAFDLAEKLDLVPGSELKTKIMGMMEEQWNDIEDLIDVYVEKFSKGGDETVITESRKRKSATVTLAESVNMFLENDASEFTVMSLTDSQYLAIEKIFDDEYEDFIDNKGDADFDGSYLHMSDSVFDKLIKILSVDGFNPKDDGDLKDDVEEVVREIWEERYEGGDYPELSDEDEDEDEDY